MDFYNCGQLGGHIKWSLGQKKGRYGHQNPLQGLNIGYINQVLEIDTPHGILALIFLFEVGLRWPLWPLGLNMATNKN